MTTMVEKMARFCERRYNPQWTDEEFEVWWSYDPYFCEKVTVWQDGFKGTRKQRRMYEARSALEAMIDPGGYVEEAGWQKSRTMLQEDWLSLDEIGQIFNEMIQAALKEGQ